MNREYGRLYMNKALIGIAALAAVSGTSAFAADLSALMKAPVMPPACVWCGSYIGGNAGWVGSANDNVTNAGADTGATGLGSFLAAGAIAEAVRSDVSGFVGGGQIGYNYQPGPNWLIGVEADLEGATAKSSTFASFPGTAAFVPFSTSYNREFEWVSTFRMRFGVTQGSFLLYGTAGFAVGETQIGNQFICAACVPPASAVASVPHTTTGWTAGAGIEWLFGEHWSFKAEYLFIDLGNNSSAITYAYGANVSTLTSNVHDTMNIARGGINFHF